METGNKRYKLGFVWKIGDDCIILTKWQWRQCERRRGRKHPVYHNVWRFFGTTWVFGKSIQPDDVFDMCTNPQYRFWAELYRWRSVKRYAHGLLCSHMPYHPGYCFHGSEPGGAKEPHAQNHGHCRGWARKTVDCPSHPLTHESLYFYHLWRFQLTYSRIFPLEGVWKLDIVVRVTQC